MLAATTGLGDVHETFDEPYGTLSLAIEAAFLAIVAGRLLASALRTDEGVVLLGRRSPRPQMAPEQRPAARDGERAGPAGSRM